MRLLCVLLTMLVSEHAAAAAVDCFTVVDPRGEVVYKSIRTPIDLSKNISDAMAAAFPGHHLVWSQTDDACAAVDRLPERADSSPAKASATPGGNAQPESTAARGQARGSARRARQSRPG
jgi:hypothetical protein